MKFVDNSTGTVGVTQVAVPAVFGNVVVEVTLFSGMFAFI